MSREYIPLDAEARLGKISVFNDEGDDVCVMTQRQALLFMNRLANAVQHAGDICEPWRVHLREAVILAVREYGEGVR